MRWEKKTKKECIYCDAKTVVLTHKEVTDGITGEFLGYKTVYLCKTCNRYKAK